MRKTLVFLGILTMSLLVSGCVTLSVSTEVKNNGTGNKIMIVAMDDSFLKLSELAGTPTPGAGPTDPKSSSSEDPFADLKLSASNIPGAKVEDYHDDVKNRTGVKITMPFKSFDELTGLSSNEAMDGMDQITIEKSGDTITMRAKIMTGNVGEAFSTTPEAGSPSSSSAAKPTATATMSPEVEQMTQAMLQSIDFTYSVQPEGKILKYDPPGTLDMNNNRITWKLDLLKESQEIMVQWQATGSSVGASPSTATKPAATATKAASTATKAAGTATATKLAGTATVSAPRTPTTIAAAATPAPTMVPATATAPAKRSASSLLSRIPCLSAFGVIGLAGGAFWMSRRKRDEDDAA